MEPRLSVYRGVVPGQAGEKGFMKSVNFEFLRPANEALAEVAGLAEAVLHVDPGSALTRLRGFAVQRIIVEVPYSPADYREVQRLYSKCFF